jgi:hypothetical protein
MRLKWKLILVHLKTMLVSLQDKCMVCAECTTGSEIVSPTMKLQGNVGDMESHYGPFGYSVTISMFGDSGNVDAR